MSNINSLGAWRGLLKFSFLASIAFFLLMSLVSYNSKDVSIIFDSSEVMPITNWFGVLGANIAGSLLYFFGFSSWLFIFLLCWLSINYAQNRKLDKYRLIATLTLIPVISTVSYSYDFEIYSGIFPGGFFGQLFHKMLGSIFSSLQTDVLLYMLLCAMLLMIIRFSFVSYLYPIAYYLFLIKYLSMPINKAKDAILYAINLINLFIDKLSFMYKKAEQETQDIYSDPFWGDLINPAQKESLAKQNQDRASKQNIKEIDLPINLDSNDNVSDNLEGPVVQGNIYRLPQNIIAAMAAEHIVDKGSLQEGEAKAKALEHKLERFGINGKVTSITHGPVVTLFEYMPSVDTKISNILAREDDLALALQAVSLRIIAPIPGRSVVGFEVAHNKRSAVLFSDILKSDQFVNCKGHMPLILGKDTLGENVVIDLSTTPHLLVAGSTGSGKSVGLNAMIMSLLCAKTPDEIKFILIDPKRLEFSTYADIAHLIFPIVTDPAKAIISLKWAVKTMEERYTLMAAAGVRNITEYNNLAAKNKTEKMPFIVIIIDELSDLMMTAGKDVEHLIARLAQMARAAGLHLIVATQRPSVDVITGLIKVNFPSRIGFKVTSKVDSRTILDTVGAERLLGKGDMLYLDTKGAMNRVHGAYVTDQEIASVINHIKQQRAVEYVVLAVAKTEDNDEDNDEIFDQVIDYISEKDEISISLIQRVFRIGYNRSARIIDKLEAQGYIAAADGSKMRKVSKNT